MQSGVLVDNIKKYTFAFMRHHKDKQASLHFTAGYILYNCVCDE